jgi:hypothetical protein
MPPRAAAGSCAITGNNAADNSQQLGRALGILFFITGVA